jgi:hypothetical protein
MCRVDARATVAQVPEPERREATGTSHMSREITESGRRESNSRSQLGNPLGSDFLSSGKTLHGQEEPRFGHRSLPSISGGFRREWHGCGTYVLEKFSVEYMRRDPRDSRAIRALLMWVASSASTRPKADKS